MGDRHDLSEWEIEPSLPRSTAERDALRLRESLTTMRITDRVEDNPALWQEIVARPDDDEPRRAYAAWFGSQPAETAQRFARFMLAQLRVAAAFRADPRADVVALRTWSDSSCASVPDFRAAVPMRRSLTEPLRLLLADGLVGWPQFYRGAVERVVMRARRFLDVGDELLRVAPIRHLVLTGVPDVVSELARTPLLARIRSLSLPAYELRDALTNGDVATFLESPHLSALAHVRLVHQRKLTERSYEQIATARTLPQLSCLEVFVIAQWSDSVQECYAPIGRRDRMFARDTTRNVRRVRHWIDEIEQRIGHAPCLHPEIYYRPDYVDLESVVEHPIARDAHIMGNRGRHLVDPSARANSDVQAPPLPREH